MPCSGSVFFRFDMAVNVATEASWAGWQVTKRTPHGHALNHDRIARFRRPRILAAARAAAAPRENAIRGILVRPVPVARTVWVGGATDLEILQSLENSEQLLRLRILVEPRAL